MNEKENRKISKFLSLILRHQPEIINLKLDRNGWAEVHELIQKAKNRNFYITKDILEEVVVTNDKKRFVFNEDKSKIRANQGHSLQNIDLELESIQPPEFLYHGTVSKFIDNIQLKGLKKMSRQHVHLSEDLKTANKVGSRRGKPIILKIQSELMFKEGYQFYKSENEVWLTDAVPPIFIDFINKL